VGIINTAEKFYLKIVKEKFYQLILIKFNIEKKVKILLEDSKREILSMYFDQII